MERVFSPFLRRGDGRVKLQVKRRGCPGLSRLALVSIQGSSESRERWGEGARWGEVGMGSMHPGEQMFSSFFFSIFFLQHWEKCVG